MIRISDILKITAILVPIVFWLGINEMGVDTYYAGQMARIQALVDANNVQRMNREYVSGHPWMDKQLKGAK